MLQGPWRGRRLASTRPKVDSVVDGHAGGKVPHLRRSEAWGCVPPDVILFLTLTQMLVLWTLGRTRGTYVWA